MLTLCTLSGADDATDLAGLLKIQNHYQFVEYGILWSDSKRGQPRYPSEDWLLGLSQASVDYENIATNATFNFSLHLCGDSVLRFIEEYNAKTGEFYLGRRRFVINRMFKRIQFNFNGQVLGQMKPSIWPKFARLLNKLYEPDIGAIRPIMQFNRNNLEAFYELGHCRHLQVLLDDSLGTGKPPEKWLRRLPRFTCGYAGGLGPHNIQTQFPLIQNAARLPSGQYADFWIDMESGIRVDNRFDLYKCGAVLVYLKNRQQGMLNEQFYEQAE